MADQKYKQRFVLNVSLCIVLCLCLRVNGQNDQAGRYYGRDGAPYVPPNPGDRDYKTFTYNNRRYGQPQHTYYNGRGGYLDPSRIGGVPPSDRHPYDPVRYKYYQFILVYRLYTLHVCVTQNGRSPVICYFYIVMK